VVEREVGLEVEEDQKLIGFQRLSGRLHAQLL
jgi:hypothetical protein